MTGERGRPCQSSQSSPVIVKMSSRSLLLIFCLATMVSVSWPHLLDPDGFHGWRYNLPQGPHPLPPPPHLQHLPHRTLPLIPLQHPQVILVPVHIRASFPPFIERIVQRVQTWWSFYNPPEELTRPPPTGEPTTTSSPKRKPTTTTTTTAVPKQDDETEATTTEATEAVETTTPAATSDSSVSTLAVYEVTPSASDLTEDTEEPLYITPEKASLLGGHREAYLRFLQTGTLPPYLETDTINDNE